MNSPIHARRRRGMLTFSLALAVVPLAASACTPVTQSTPTVRQLTSAGENRRPSISDNGLALVFDTGGSINMTNNAGACCLTAAITGDSARVSGSGGWIVNRSSDGRTAHLFSRLSGAVFDLPNPNSDGVVSPPSISSDGRFVTYGAVDSSGVAVIVIYDSITATTVNAAIGSTTGSTLLAPVISGNGRYIAFTSDAAVLPGAPTGYNAYLYERDTATVALASGTNSVATLATDVDADGDIALGLKASDSITRAALWHRATNTIAIAPTSSSQAVMSTISDDGQYATISSITPTATLHIDEVDLATGSSFVVGDEGFGFNRAYPDASADGRYVTFESTNDVTGSGVNAGHFNVFVWTRGN